MPERFIPLSCPNCGARLEVYDDMSRFACGHCGTEVMAERRGGAVLLKSVTEAIRRVQVGTDKTAAELALGRFNNELAENAQAIANIRSENSLMGPGCFAISVAVIGPFFCAIALQPSAIGIAAVCFWILAPVLFFFMASANNTSAATQIAPLQAQAEELQLKIQDARRIANS